MCLDISGNSAAASTTSPITPTPLSSTVTSTGPTPLPSAHLKGALLPRGFVCWAGSECRNLRNPLPIFSVCTWRLNRFHGNDGHVVYEPDFLLHKRLSVGDAAEHPVIAGHGFNASANFFLRGKDFAARILIGELRLVSHQRLEARFELVGDVDDKRRAYVAIKAGINNLEGTMSRTLRRQLGESR